MKKIEFIKKIGFISVLTLTVCAVVMLGGCRKKTVSETGENIVQTDPTQTESGQTRNYDVQLDERTEDTQYQYGEDDLCLVDTVSGKKVVLGMTQEEVEAITGATERTDRDTLIYDGIVVKYKDGIAVTLSVSNGVFEGDKATRYKTSRGIGINATHEDFDKAYGNEFRQGSESVDEATGETVKTASRATRYFKKDGNKIEFLGTTLTKEQLDEDTSNYYLQDFMFSNKTGNIATLRVSLYSVATGGI